MNKIDEVINDKEKLYIRINKGITRALKRQKEEGKKFITDEQIDALIDQVIKEEVN